MKTRNVNPLKALSLLFVMAAASGLVLSGVAAAQDPFTGNPVAAIAEKASPAVVNIDTEAMVKRSFSPFAEDPFFRRFFGEEFENFSRVVPMRGKGSGFIVTDDGYIITNNHVVQGADKISVSLSDGRTFEAKPVGRDPTFDLAVVKIDAKGLPTLELGESEKAAVGEWVVAIGNPYGFEHSVTVGVLSAKNRSVHAGDINFDGFLQTDAAINPGNSGGPLLNLEGQVIGINTAIVPYAQGIGFAIPVDMAKDVLNDLIRFGKVNRGWLGVYIQPLTREFAETYRFEGEKGAVVADVVPGSPADRSGIMRGDVIVSINGKEVESHQDVSSLVRRQLASDTIRVEIVRGGTKKNIDVKLDEIPGQILQTEKVTKLIEKMGIEVSSITKELQQEFKLPGDEGAVVSKVVPGLPADRLGLRRGDLILEINGVKVKAAQSLEESFSGQDKAVVLLIWREGRTFFVSMRI